MVFCLALLKLVNRCPFDNLMTEEISYCPGYYSLAYSISVLRHSLNTD